MQGFLIMEQMGVEPNVYVLNAHCIASSVDIVDNSVDKIVR